MKKLPTKIQDAWLLKTEVFTDARGFFFEAWNRETFREIGLDFDFAYGTHSEFRDGSIRGLLAGFIPIIAGGSGKAEFAPREENGFALRMRFNQCLALLPKLLEFSLFPRGATRI